MKTEESMEAAADLPSD